LLQNAGKFYGSIQSHSGGIDVTRTQLERRLRRLEEDLEIIDFEIAELRIQLARERALKRVETAKRRVRVARGCGSIRQMARPAGRL
jgi:hypothetical protein